VGSSWGRGGQGLAFSGGGEEVFLFWDFQDVFLLWLCDGGCKLRRSEKVAANESTYHGPRAQKT